MLWREGAGHVVEPADPIFPQFKVKVILRRTEDKNTFLDRHLEKLEGKTVIARVGLDTWRPKEQDSTVYLYSARRFPSVEADPRSGRLSRESMGTKFVRRSVPFDRERRQRKAALPPPK